jgi:3-isopropylmalate dehydrogenase
MCLRYSFNMIEEADLIEKSIANVLDCGLRTGDIMSDGCTKVGTTAMGGAILDELKALSA